MFSFFIHTHTDCKDIWPIFFGQLDKYFPEHSKKVLVNCEDDFLTPYEISYYDQKSEYTSRIKNALLPLGDQIILFSHEDMILYDTPLYNTLGEYCDLIKNDKADFIKLLKCMDTPGDFDFPVSDVHPNLSPCPKQYSFTIQPTLCKASKLLDVLSSCAPTNIWDFEAKVFSIFTNFIHNKCYMSSFKKESKRGLAHWDSAAYPHGNIIRNGKWNSEYRAEIKTLCGEYGADFQKRDIT